MPDFELKEKLGEGNYGSVWLDYNRALDKDVAVKFVPVSSIDDPTEFYREPKILAKLTHPNIVTVYDAGIEAENTLYIVMEYLSRGSIKQMYRGRPIPLTTARRYLYDVCWGLEYAHNKGYIHRDIKPANILINDKRRAKISDFGLATSAPRGRYASACGYIVHLAPEVFTEGETSILSDIYALGVTAYRVMNGDKFLPMTTDDDELKRMIVNGKYPRRDHYRPCVPRQLRLVINKAMNIIPEKRYQSVAAFRRALENVTLRCNWKWVPKRYGVHYSTKIASARINTRVIHRQDRLFDIVTTKKITGGLKRRIMKDCFYGLTLSRMKSSLHMILARYVSAGK